MKLMDDIDILYAALNLAAADEETWEAGYNAWLDALRDYKSTEEAYYNALDAAAPDKEAWVTAQTYLQMMGRLPQYHAQQLPITEKVVGLARKTGEGFRSLVNNRKDASQ